jgi:tryptophan-rich sensory protein
MNPIIYNISIPVFLAIIMNGIIYTFGINKEVDKENNKDKKNDKKNEERKDDNKLKFLPPGYIVGAIWVLIFALLGYSHYLAYNVTNSINFGSLSIIILILYSLAYPLITGLKPENSDLYNIIALILSFSCALIISLFSKYILLYILPLLLWVSYVNIVFAI